MTSRKNPHLQKDGRQESAGLPNPINILGVAVTPLTVDSLHAYMASLIDSGQKEIIPNVNVQCMNLAYENEWLRTFLNSTNVVFCDGAGVIAGAKLLGQRIPERITFADWTWQLAEYCEPREYTLFLLGAKPGIVELAAEQLHSRFPELKIVGTHHGYFEKSAQSAENAEVIRQINEAKPDILILGFGMPLQEKWLLENWTKIDTNIALTGGAVFDYLSGSLNRAPKWMTENSLEWLGRLVIEPQRLWRRYLVGNPRFIWRVLKQRAGETNP